MALMANGSRLMQEGYQFAVRVCEKDGTHWTFLCDSSSDAEAMAAQNESHGLRAQVVFRTVYVTGWEETTDWEITGR